MSIDPSIPLSVRLPVIHTPMENAHAAAQLANERATLTHLGGQNRALTLENQQRENAMASEKAIAAAMLAGYGGGASTNTFTGPDDQQPATAPISAPASASGSAPAPSAVPTPFVGPRPMEMPPPETGSAPPSAAVSSAPPAPPAEAGAPPSAAALPSSAPDLPAGPGPSAPSPSRQPPKFDPDKFMNAAIKSGVPGAVVRAQAVLKGLTAHEKETAEIQKIKSDLEDKQHDAAARVAVAAKTKGADGVEHYDPDVLLGGLYHAAVDQQNPAAAKAIQMLHAATDPKLRQQLADEWGRKLEAGASAATITARARQSTAETSATRLALETPKIQAETANAQTTGEEKKTQNAAAQLAAATTADQYRRVYRGLPVAIAEKFDSPDSFDPKTTPDRARQIGMTPAQQQTGAHEKVLEAQGAKRIQLSWAEFQEHVRHNKNLEEGTTLSPEAVEKAADMMATTGTLPPLGMGAAAASMRSKILDRAAKKYADVDWASAGAQFKADQGSLGAMQKQRDAVGAFEDTALKNVKVFEDAAKKVIDTGSPLLNKPLRAIDQKVLGSGEQAAFNTARLTVIPEFAKILNNPNLSGQLSDSARHEIDTILDKDATLKQIYDSIAVLKKDTANRRQSYDDAIVNIQKRITQKTSGKTPSDSGVTVTSPSGKSYTLKDQAAADAFVADAKTKGLWK